MLRFDEFHLALDTGHVFQTWLGVVEQLVRILVEDELSGKELLRGLAVRYAQVPITDGFEETIRDVSILALPQPMDARRNVRLLDKPHVVFIGDAGWAVLDELDAILLAGSFEWVYLVLVAIELAADRPNPVARPRSLPSCEIQVNLMWQEVGCPWLVERSVPEKDPIVEPLRGILPSIVFWTRRPENL
jgi:hypothetical protein